MVADTVEAFPPFPLDDVREFAAEELSIDEDGYRGMFQNMKNLARLRLEQLKIWPVLHVLSSDNHGTSGIVTRTTLIHLHARR